MSWPLTSLSPLSLLAMLPLAHSSPPLLWLSHFLFQLCFLLLIFFRTSSSLPHCGVVNIPFGTREGRMCHPLLVRHLHWPKGNIIGIGRRETSKNGHTINFHCPCHCKSCFEAPSPENSPSSSTARSQQHGVLELRRVGPNRGSTRSARMSLSDQWMPSLLLG